MGRAALKAPIEVGGTPIDLLTCDLKSKLLGFPPGPNSKPRFNPKEQGERASYAVYALTRRAAEAATVRAAANPLLGNQGMQLRVMVLGDLNDLPEAATTQILQGLPGSEIGTVAFQQPDQGDNQWLWNLAPWIKASRSPAMLSPRVRSAAARVDDLR